MKNIQTTMKKTKKDRGKKINQMKQKKKKKQALMTTPRLEKYNTEY